MEILDTPLNRQKKKYEELLAGKDQEIAQLKINISKVRGVNDLLRFELISLEKTIEEMKKHMVEAVNHVQNLKSNLPNLD